MNVLLAGEHRELWSNDRRVSTMLVSQQGLQVWHVIILVRYVANRLGAWFCGLALSLPEHSDWRLANVVQLVRSRIEQDNSYINS